MQVRSLGWEDLPFPGKGNGTPLQYSYLENPMDRGALRMQSAGSLESNMTEHAGWGHKHFPGLPHPAVART